MPTLKYNRGGFGTKKGDGKWFLNHPTRGISKFLDDYEKEIESLDSIDDIKNYVKKEMDKIDQRDIGLRKKVAALRIAALRQVDDIGGDSDVDSFEQQFESGVESWAK